MSNPPSTTGILLVGHGTRDETGTRQFLELAEILKIRLAPAAVEAAFLELREPGIGAGVERLLARGIDRLVTVPLLLFAAGHIKRDVPEEVEKALVALGRGDLQHAQAGHLGCHAALLELSHRRMEEVHCAALMHPTCLLLVARGSKDDEASAEMHHFAALRGQTAPNLIVEAAFLSIAQPSFDEQLRKLVTAGYPRVIVQPHFLFEGELVERIRSQIADCARNHSKTEWLVAPPLADRPGEKGLASDLLARVILDRLQEAGIRVVVSPGDD
jgi:sirohydrochlorin cobaltochelatase